MTSSTISAVTQRVSSFNWTDILNNPFVQYIISPTIVFGILVFIIIKAFNLGELKEKLLKSLESIKDLDKDVKKLLSHVDIIKTHLVDKTGLDANLFGAQSPVVLLEKGKELLEKTGFKKIYRENKKWFINEIRNYQVKTLSDLDEVAFKIMEKCRNDNKFANFKELAFQNGVSLDVLLRVLSIYLRDEVSGEILTHRE